MPLLILDLDETLIYGSENVLDREPDFETESFFIYERPGVRQFIEDVAQSFELAVWSSASREYVDRIVERLFEGRQLAFVWAVERCTRRRNLEYDYFYWVKDLKKVKRRGYDLSQVLMIEDTPDKAERNFGNAIYVAPFEGDPTDDELPRLGRYLKSISDRPDFRRFEKRGWRTRVETSAD